MMTSKLCYHPDRKEIDTALVDQRTLRDIATQNETHRSSLARHKPLTKAKQAETVAETLLSRIEKLASRRESFIGKTEDDENWPTGWRRETGEDLAKRPEDLNSHAVMAIGFDFAEERDWTPSPKVRLKHQTLSVDSERARGADPSARSR
jgi:hypothetical protein